MTHVSTPIFQGLFKNIVFRSLALVINKLLAILDFFCTLKTFTTLNPTLCRKKKNLQKNPSNYYLLKVKKFHGDSVTNESAKAKKLQGGAPNAPPPSLLRVKREFKMTSTNPKKFSRNGFSSTELFDIVLPPFSVNRS